MKIYKCKDCGSEDLNVWESGDYLTVRHIDDPNVLIDDGGIIEGVEYGDNETALNSQNSGYTCNNCGYSWDS